LLQPLDFFYANIQQANGGPRQAKKAAGHGFAHDGKFNQLGSIGADGGAHIKNNAFTPQRGPDCGYGWPGDAGQGFQHKTRHGHQCACIAR
jgi:hypothetical protein